ncbi:MAG: peptide-methionine (S)-S-oxide reductase MsrA [Gammaproteobacteria bacterium]|nr:peptide-methionine (S)-S-oxide reductase MsrA [Gammaproteobacteria bacterium]MDE0248161.1 peptide-methionine (S)-S-oxide reductase MsrA [Gammaproteobacteria bacterium]
MSGNGREAVAVLGGGCFWCLEAVYRGLRGVSEVVSGYAGGTHPNPTYRLVCRGRTGHAEVVRVTFDPAVISYRTLLGVFFTIHDPTTRDRQGADVGPQYRSIILYADEAERREAEAVIREIEAEGLYAKPVVTELAPLGAFHPAEPEHDDYFRRNPWQPYCRAVIAPKVGKARERFRDHYAEGAPGGP